VLKKRGKISTRLNQKKKKMDKNLLAFIIWKVAFPTRGF